MNNSDDGRYIPWYRVRGVVLPRIESFAEAVSEEQGPSYQPMSFFRTSRLHAL